jgi:hypothetical protein
VRAYGQFFDLRFAIALFYLFAAYAKMFSAYLHTFDHPYRLDGANEPIRHAAAAARTL